MDTFIHHNHVDRKKPSESKKCYFDIDLNEKGNPQACNVLWVPKDFREKALASFSVAAAAARPPAPTAAASSASTSAAGGPTSSKGSAGTSQCTTASVPPPVTAPGVVPPTLVAGAALNAGLGAGQPTSAASAAAGGASLGGPAATGATSSRGFANAAANRPPGGFASAAGSSSSLSSSSSGAAAGGARASSVNLNAGAGGSGLVTSGAPPVTPPTLGDQISALLLQRAAAEASGTDAGALPALPEPAIFSTRSSSSAADSDRGAGVSRSHSVTDAGAPNAGGLRDGGLMTPPLDDAARSGGGSGTGLEGSAELSSSGSAGGAGDAVESSSSGADPHYGGVAAECSADGVDLATPGGTAGDRTTMAADGAGNLVESDYFESGSGSPSEGEERDDGDAGSDDSDDYQPFRANLAAAADSWEEDSASEEGGGGAEGAVDGDDSWEEDSTPEEKVERLAAGTSSRGMGRGAGAVDVARARGAASRDGTAEMRSGDAARDLLNPQFVNTLMEKHRAAVTYSH